MTAAQRKDLQMTASSESSNNPFVPSGFYTDRLKNTDPEIWKSITNEFHRQQDTIELIASENIVSQAVMDAQGTILTNKYAEGYPGKRYYGGCEFVDVIEQIAIDRACQLFGAKYANVQPHSGSQANQAVYFALLNPGDKVLGMRLDHGGHLTHGMKINQSGKWFDFAAYGVRAEDELLDYEEVRRLAHEHKPKMIVCGASAYSRTIDWAKFREIADEVKAYLFVDIAHYAGLVVGGAYPNPVPYANVVTTTTHKTLRGPRGAMILCNDPEMAKKINSAVFPGLQGGPLEHVIAAKAVAFGEALQPEFKLYAQQIVKNARAMADTFMSGGMKIISGGTDSHLMLLDLRSLNITGKAAQLTLDEAGLTANKNGIPNDPQPPTITSGIRLGTPAGTSRGFREPEFQQIATWIMEVLRGLSASPDDNSAIEHKVRAETRALCQRFPIYPNIG